MIDGESESLISTHWCVDLARSSRRVTSRRAAFPSLVIDLPHSRREGLACAAPTLRRGGTLLFSSQIYQRWTGEYFDLKEDHPNREAAENYVVAKLIELGETEYGARYAASHACYGTCDAVPSPHGNKGHSARIWEKGLSSGR